MAENSSYPQIPATVWWGVRALLNKSPRGTLSEDVLGAELNVQPAAARQYVSELRRVGILGDENKATPVANKWRMDDTYAEAVAEILDGCYGEGLRTIASEQADRNKAVEWFKRQGLGEGSARNKAATYFLIASSQPGESGQKGAVQSQGKGRTSRSPRGDKQASSPAAKADESSGAAIFPVNLNLQIHISADATTDQIEAIFIAMRKHLGNAQFS